MELTTMIESYMARKTKNANKDIGQMTKNAESVVLNN